MGTKSWVTWPMEFSSYACEPGDSRFQVLSVLKSHSGGCVVAFVFLGVPRSRSSEPSSSILCSRELEASCIGAVLRFGLNWLQSPWALGPRKVSVTGEVDKDVSDLI